MYHWILLYTRSLASTNFVLTLVAKLYYPEYEDEMPPEIQFLASGFGDPDVGSF